MLKWYEEAQKTSGKGEQGASISIPWYDLKTYHFIPTGFQPLGIASKIIDKKNTLLAVTDYSYVAIAIYTVTSEPEGLRFTSRWIRGVNYQGSSVRIFPDIFGPGDANRVQTINFGPDGTLWISRNANREFFILSPSGESSEKWSLIDRRRLPGEDILHSALFEDDRIMTAESTPDLKVWHQREYRNFLLFNEVLSEPMTYGFARNLDGRVLTITDWRAEEPLGVYVDNKLVFPCLYGTGMAILHNDAFIIAGYGYGISKNPFRVPGQLVYIPPGYI